MSKSISRKFTVVIPEEVTVDIKDKILSVVGPKGTNTYDFSHVMFLFGREENQITLTVYNARRIDIAKVGTCVGKIQKMIQGAIHGFAYRLKAAYKHFPISFDVQNNGKKVGIKNFLGQKKIRTFRMFGESKIELGTEKDTVIVSGCSIEDVSQSAGQIQNSFIPKNLDTRIFLDGIYIDRKENAYSN